MGKAGVRSQESGVKVETWEQANGVMAAHALNAARLAAQNAALEKALAHIRATYQRELDLLDAEMSESKSALEKFADSRKAEFKASPDGDGRSYEHAGVSIGFRKLLDKVALPRGDARKEVSLEYLEQYRPEFVRRTPEFDLVALLAALKDGDSDLLKALAEHGITLKAGRDEFFLKVA